MTPPAAVHDEAVSLHEGLITVIQRHCPILTSTATALYPTMQDPQAMFLLFLYLKLLPLVTHTCEAVHFPSGTGSLNTRFVALQ
jgi:hypothetical protein